MYAVARRRLLPLNADAATGVRWVLADELERDSKRRNVNGLGPLLVLERPIRKALQIRRRMIEKVSVVH